MIELRFFSWVFFIFWTVAEKYVRHPQLALKVMKIHININLHWKKNPKTQNLKYIKPSTHYWLIPFFLTSLFVCNSSTHVFNGNAIISKSWNHIYLYIYVFIHILQSYIYLWILHMLLTSTIEKSLKKIDFAFSLIMKN